MPRGLGEGGDQSLIRALANDLGLGGFRSAGLRHGRTLDGPKPAALLEVIADPWRTNGDTVERLELLRSGPALPTAKAADPSFDATDSVPASQADRRTNPCIDRSTRTSALPCAPAAATRSKRCSTASTDASSPPAPPARRRAGASTCCPPAAISTRSTTAPCPRPTAWTLGQKSAEDLLARHFQDFGRYPQGPRAFGLGHLQHAHRRRRHRPGPGASSAPSRSGSRRAGASPALRSIPLAKLGRPRVDVTLRISGFFRDAFPAQIELFDKAIRAIGALDEDEADNPIAARMRGRSARPAKLPACPANRRAPHRPATASSARSPAAYGAGLQALIDEKLWAERADLAARLCRLGRLRLWRAAMPAFRTSAAFGAAPQAHRGRRPQPGQSRARSARIRRLLSVRRRHDGGGRSRHRASSPRVYHNDHSRPERPVIRTLEEEVGRVMRSRVVNPEMDRRRQAPRLQGRLRDRRHRRLHVRLRRHHRRGEDPSFRSRLRCLSSPTTRPATFIAANNPAALEGNRRAIRRGAWPADLWTPRSNSAYDLLARRFSKGLP